MIRLALVGALFLVLVPAAGCREDEASEAQAAIRETHLPALLRTIEEDVVRHRQGIREAATRLAPGFEVEDEALRERQMRAALRYVQEPPKGISELIISPKSFLAAVDANGKVIARDADPDRMKGMDMKARFAVVRGALEEGQEGFELGLFERDGERSISMLFAAPVKKEDATRGAIVTGIPLWRMAQRLSRQLRVEHAAAIEKGLVLWAYLVRGDEVFHFGTPPELDAVLPDANARREALSTQPTPTGHVKLHARTYAWGLAKAPAIGDDVALLVFRSDAK